MSFESVNQCVLRLSTSMEALAALGADIRLRREGLEADPRVRVRLNEVVRALDSTLFDGLSEHQEANVLSTIRTAFRHALDLLDDPTRAPGWSHVDPALLQNQGQQSRRVVGWIDTFAANRPDFKKILEQPGAFLDVGSGAGWLAIEAAQTWPALRTVGLDPWDPALTLARTNIAAAGLEGRIELRSQRIEQIQDQDQFTLVWLPGPFLAPDIVPAALERTYRALRPDGWIVFGLFGSSEPIGDAVQALRIVRNGGHPWRTAEIEERLRNRGFTQVETTAPGGPTLFVVGKKPSHTNSSPTTPGGM